ncbi:MerR family transcriptional regulator [Levilactobacillus humaensis]|uniref:MerR family transcriptional regulator n=1 Tax=Levilactobacillus humaensis TaxID=2950375 RepID=UPI0021C2DF43|nr:MerR family transcriptional regulator [Levilactobacillus humaensis]
MLAIQKFATLAGTTRRTLIFYDEKNLFKPKRVAENGYRYYDYDQLYDLTFILELRHLGLSISEIKALTQNADPSSLNDNLQHVLGKINAQLDNLAVLKSTLNTRFNQPIATATPVKNQPAITTVTETTTFCRSRQSVACTEEEIAEIYAEFYANLGKLKLVNKEDSGFLTRLPGSNANLYPTASFCILKKVTAGTDTDVLPQLTKPTGDYVTITTTNDTKNICIGLRQLADYIAQNQLHVGDQLWQMNLDETFTSKGASQLVNLQYQLQ